MASIKEFTNKQGKRRWRVHYVENGTTRHPEFRTFEEACHRLYLEEMHRLHNLTPTKFLFLTDFTVKKVIWLYLGGQWAKVLGKTLAQSTYRKAERELLSIPDEFAAYRVSNVSKTLVVRFVREKTFIWLRAAFRLLVDEGVIMFNPCPRPVKRGKIKVTPPPLDEVQRIFDVAGTPPLKMFVFLCAVCGLRTGEALAVKWEDIHDDCLLVRNHLTADGMLEGTKRNAGRSLPLPREFFDLASKLDKASKYLVYLPTKSNVQVNEQSFRTHQTIPMYRMAGVKYSNHALRHFAAANWIAEGRNVKELQVLLGHDDVMTTLRVYGHLFDAPKQINSPVKIG